MQQYYLENLTARNGEIFCTKLYGERTFMEKTSLERLTINIIYASKPYQVSPIHAGDMLFLLNADLFIWKID